MQENHCILVNSTDLLLLCKVNQNFFPVNLSEPTRVLDGSSEEWPTVEAGVTYINKYIKELCDIISFAKQFQELKIVSLI
jgi:hypothetical protein